MQRIGAGCLCDALPGGTFVSLSLLTLCFLAALSALGITEVGEGQQPIVGALMLQVSADDSQQQQVSAALIFM